jgi:hypothetical protein
MNDIYDAIKSNQSLKSKLQDQRRATEYASLKLDIPHVTLTNVLGEIQDLNEHGLRLLDRKTNGVESINVAQADQE